MSAAVVSRRDPQTRPMSCRRAIFSAWEPGNQPLKTRVVWVARGPSCPSVKTYVFVGLMGHQSQGDSSGHKHDFQYL